jgi:hypothetical protein
MERAKAGYIRPVTIEGTKRQIDDGLVYDVTSEKLSQVCVIADHSKSAVVEAAHSRPIVVNESEQSVSAFRAGHDLLSKGNRAWIRSKDQHVAKISTASTNMCKRNSKQHT